MNNRDYITIQGWMINELQLSGSELIFYALAYRYCEGYPNEFISSLNEVSSTLNISKERTKKVLSKLEEKGLLSIKKVVVDNISLYSYKVYESPNICYNESDKPAISIFSNNLFPELQEIKKDEKKTLFRNSKLYSLVLFDDNGEAYDYTKFEAEFNTSDYEQINLRYYFHVVSDWSDLKNMKRTNNGWKATIRNFIRTDLKNNTLKIKEEYKGADKVDYKGLLDVIEGGF